VATTEIKQNAETVLQLFQAHYHKRQHARIYANKKVVLAIHETAVTLCIFMNQLILILGL